MTDWLPAVLVFALCEWISLIRHEGAHALVVAACGADVTAFRVWPHLHQGHFYFGRVSYSGLDPEDRDAVLAAPYLVDAMCIVTWYFMFPETTVANIATAPLWRWAMHCVLLISPLIDLGYNLVKAIVWKRGDLHKLAGGIE